MEVVLQKNTLQEYSNAFTEPTGPGAGKLEEVAWAFLSASIL